jgi:hypothetical protein
MNKRWWMLAVALLLAAGAGLFAQERRGPAPQYFSAGAGLLTAFSDGKVSLSPGLQAAWVNPRLFTNFMGLGVHAGAYVHIDTSPVKVNGFIASLLAGPAFMVFDNGRFRLPVTAGVHADYARASGDWVWNIGAGAAADLVWQFGERAYAYARVQGACNFGVLEFLLSPGLGVGLRF